MVQASHFLHKMTSSLNNGLLSRSLFSNNTSNEENCFKWWTVLAGSEKEAVARAGRVFLSAAVGQTAKHVHLSESGQVHTGSCPEEQGWRNQISPALLLSTFPAPHACELSRRLQAPETLFRGEGWVSASCRAERWEQGVCTGVDPWNEQQLHATPMEQPPICKIPRFWCLLTENCLWNCKRVSLSHVPDNRKAVYCSLWLSEWQPLKLILLMQLIARKGRKYIFRSLGIYEFILEGEWERERERRSLKFTSK